MYQGESFPTAAERNERWAKLRESGTVDVVRYTTQVLTGEVDTRERPLGRQEFVVAWPVRS
jgi:hypothetical protein